jgi:hypothetical protein
MMVGITSIGLDCGEDLTILDMDHKQGRFVM